MKSSDYKEGRESLLKDLLRIGSREVSHHYDSGRFVIYDLDVWDRFCRKELGSKEEYYSLIDKIEEEERKETEARNLSEMKATVTRMKKEIPLLEIEIVKRESKNTKKVA